MISNVYKVSMSPWVEEERGSAEIGGDFLCSRKPNPFSVAKDGFDAATVQENSHNTRELCVKNGCPMEYIHKDISSVRYEPTHLTEWANIAMQVVEG
ncbi:MAG: hypothetical protein HN431_13855 [Bacteroidetes bacterium]|nr:hypothetical protein [Bacteroidota bacterium]